MRFGIGKRVGGVYVGASASGSSILKFIYWFFAWPFYLAYFMLVWPFVKLYQHFKKKKVLINATAPQTVTIDSVTYTMSSAEARSMIQRKKKIADDSIRLVQETKNPDVFLNGWKKPLIPFGNWQRRTQYVVLKTTLKKFCRNSMQTGKG